MTPSGIKAKLDSISLGNKLTMAVLVIGMAVTWGSATTRLSALEDFRAYQLAANDRQTASQQAMATEWRNLAIELKETRTILNERTDRAETRQQLDASANRTEIRRAEDRQRLEATANREAIDKNRAAIPTKQHTGKKKSLATALGLSK